MHKSLFIIVLLMATAVALAENPEDQGCEPMSADIDKCISLTPQEDLTVTFDSDINCYSSYNESCTKNCAQLMDGGCFADISTSADHTYSIKFIMLNIHNGSRDYVNEDVPVTAGAYTAMIAADQIDYSTCTSEAFEDLGVEYTCRAENTTVTYDGAVLSGIENMETSFILLEKSGSETERAINLITANWVYVLLALIVMIAVIMTFLRKK